MKKIVYVVGGLVGLTGMSSILYRKINYLAEHTDYDLYMILTEKPEMPWSYKINPRVKWVNFNINFDELDTMPMHKKVLLYLKKQRKYKRLFTQYLMELKPDITVSALRREINFINDIHDGSKKIGEIHFERTFYRNFNSPHLPKIINKLITRYWMGTLIKNLKRLDRFVVLTHEDYEHWPELSNKIVIPNFISEYDGPLAKLDSKSAIAIGRYTWQKGFDLLIEAWESVAEKHPDWTLNIYGAGEKVTYQKIVANKKLTKQIHCYDAVSNVYEKYIENSFFVFSSRYEGFGLVLAEAMSTGLPAVSFACPCGPSDIITNKKDGILIENGNISRLADGICELIEDTEKRKELGHNAHIKAKEFYPDTVMKKWLNLFESL
ncbi:glycosyltransferase family 4 protein [uncultured Methanobrevibacter sp.]|uniref:glycosyltransferase family 4 protein n=1 Tax=uncultured Methanobrevibacter sp. TaxID=253161 RepID=UPI0025D52C42|nr:glycosyltransferase family 4 protein [uncultured Methanobrevibacter sp.]